MARRAEAEGRPLENLVRRHLATTLRGARALRINQWREPMKTQSYLLSAQDELSRRLREEFDAAQMAETTDERAPSVAALDLDGVHSIGFVPTRAGWRISRDGNAEFWSMPSAPSAPSLRDRFHAWLSSVLPMRR